MSGTGISGIPGSGAVDAATEATRRVLAACEAQSPSSVDLLQMRWEFFCCDLLRMSAWKPKDLQGIRNSKHPSLNPNQPALIAEGLLEAALAKRPFRQAGACLPFCSCGLGFHLGFLWRLSKDAAGADLPSESRSGLFKHVYLEQWQFKNWFLFEQKYSICGTLVWRVRLMGNCRFSEAIP